MIESFQTYFDCQEIEEESNYSNNGENMKDNDEDWGSVEKSIEEVNKFREKKNLFSLIQNVQKHVI